MANVYSTRFLAWAAETIPPGYIVPTGYVAVVRDVDVVSGGGAMINWVWGINDVAKIGGGQFTIEALNQFQAWRGRVVVEPGELIYFDGDGPTDGTICGYLLALP